jgi:hypothetical protein
MNSSSIAMSLKHYTPYICGSTLNSYNETTVGFVASGCGPNDGCSCGSGGFGPVDRTYDMWRFWSLNDELRKYPERWHSINRPFTDHRNDSTHYIRGLVPSYIYLQRFLRNDSESH